MNVLSMNVNNHFEDLPSFRPIEFNGRGFNFDKGLPMDLVSEGSEGTSVCTSEWSSVYTLGGTADGLIRTAAFDESLQSDANRVVGRKGVAISNPIGSGVSSQVFLGTGPRGWVAVKAIHSESDGCSKSERDLLLSLKHPNIIEIYDVLQGPPLCYLLEFCFGGDLFQALHARIKGTTNLVPLSSGFQKSVACDVAGAIAYVHSKGLIHRDIKSPNVLLKEPVLESSKCPVAKLSDFGLTKVSQLQNTAGVGTVRWMAPDLQDINYGNSADVYSFSILLWEIFSRKIPFANEKSNAHLFLKVCLEDHRPDVSQCSSASPELVELMQKCWGKEPSSRPSMEEVHAILEAHLDDSDLSSISDGPDLDDDKHSGKIQVDAEVDASSQSFDLGISKATVPQSEESQKLCVPGGLSHKGNTFCSCFHGLLRLLN